MSATVDRNMPGYVLRIQPEDGGKLVICLDTAQQVADLLADRFPGIVTTWNI